jgi:competence protein ComEC
VTDAAAESTPVADRSTPVADRSTPVADPSTPVADPSTPVADVVGPLAPWTVAAVLGAAIGALVGDRVAPTVAAAAREGASHGSRFVVVLAVVASVTTAVAAARRPTPRARAAASLVAVTVLAGVLAGARTATHHLGVLPELASRGGAAGLSLTVAAEPRRIATGWHVPVRVTEVDGRATRERAAVTLTDDAVGAPPLHGDPPALGSRWRTSGTARPLPDGGYGRWLAQQHLTVVLDVGGLGAVGDPGWLAASSEHVRARTRAAATQHTGAAVGGLLVGLVSGDTRLLPDADRAAMEATAMTHLTAVSGMHVASVVAGVLGLCALVRAGARGRRAAVAVVVLWFAYLTRFQPSVLRAGAVAGVVLLAAQRGVARDGRHALAGAVLLLILIDPLLAGSLGLLLSATAAAGVLVLAPRVRGRLQGWRWLPRRVADVLAITVGAQLAVVPLLLVTFGEVPVASVPANLVAVPLAVVTAAVAFPASALAAVHLPAGAALFAVAAVPARGILVVAHATAGRGGAADVAAPATVVALLAGAGWLLAAPRTRTARGAAVVTIVASVLAGFPAFAGRHLPVDTVTVTAIDVGQGDAFLLRSPAARVLVDTGDGDVAARWLVRNGHTDLDLLVVTHGHADHAGGVDAVLERTDTAAVWRPPSPEPSPLMTAVDRAAAAAGIPVREVVADGGRTVAATVGDLHLEVLGPPPGRPYRHAGSEVNEGSLVVRATVGDAVALFAGDVESVAQADLLAVADARVAAGEDDPLRTGLLTVPHHGAGTSDPAFLARTAPRVAVMSVGADNTYGHPHPDTLRALGSVGAVVHRTDLEGTVTVEVPPPAAPVPVGGPREEVPAGGPREEALGRVLGTHAPGRHRPSVASAHGTRPPHRRRRRPAPPARARAGPHRPARAGRRPHRRGARRERDRGPTGDADGVPVRRADLRGAARGRGPVG